VIDTALVTRKMVLIATDVEALDAYRAMDLDDYLEDPIAELVVERYVERTVGRMVDINYHLLTALGEPPPRDYFTSFTALSKVGVLPGPFAREIAPAAGLRNRIVHEYDEVEPSRVHEALDSILRDVPRYLGYVQGFLDARGPGSDAPTP